MPLVIKNLGRFAIVGLLASYAVAHAAGVTYVVPQQWSGGFKAEVTLVNDSASPINNWKFEFDYPYQITQIWNGKIVSKTGNRYAVQADASWGLNIAAKSSYSFGFIGASATPPSAKPGSCAINGAAVTFGDCGGSVVTPGNQSPVAKANGPYSVAVNKALTLSAAGSRDPDGNIVSYNWNFGDGQAANTAATQLSHTYTTAGNFTATLTVTDNAGAKGSASAAVAVTGGTPPTTGTPLARNGQLKVCGTQLCNQNGKQIQLRGMSGHGLQWFPQCYSNNALDALAKDWGADVVRIAMYVQEGGYENDPAGYKVKIDALVDEVSKRGMYVIVDWHILTPGNPLVNLTKAKDFFDYMSRKHAARKNIIYEIANEPNGTSWADIKSYAEQVIPIIRANDPDGIVLVGTRGWSSFGIADGSGPEEIIASPVNAGNIMYSFHFYSASHRDDYVAGVNKTIGKIPVFVTEFGTQQNSGDGANDFTMAQKFIDVFQTNKISWVNWNFSDNGATGAVLNGNSCNNNAFTGTALKESGKWVQTRMLTPADDF